MPDLLNLIMPGNARYQPKELQQFFGYDNSYLGVAMVELANLEVLYERGLIPYVLYQTLSQNLKVVLKKITATQVDKTEREKTKHDIRAWILEAQNAVINHVGNISFARFLHIPLTSYDALDTGRSLMYLYAYEQVTRPTILDLLWDWCDKVYETSNMVQIGRTHGQHAIPITVGFWLAPILWRFYYNYLEMERHAQSLFGTISGAVGTYNAQVALGIYKDKGGGTYEEAVLKKLGLKPAPISTQILPPDPLAHFLFSHVLASGSLGQLGRDGRNLMRSEISEISEGFTSQQSGSSTMAHKRNPITFENIESQWLKMKNEFGKVLEVIISDHQRDLTNSAIVRDFPTIIILLQEQMNKLLKEDESGKSFIGRIQVNEEALRRNLQTNANVLTSELMYISLILAGYQGDAHHLVNHEIVPLAQAGKINIWMALEIRADNDEVLSSLLPKIKPDIINTIKNPETYIGVAKEKAEQISSDIKMRILDRDSKEKREIH
ncbi:MAG: lyase family protein [Candidatus Komeilibacteria bacterium]|nr:lyase family protein [Candidatus Komeilibacteria bacterium]